MNITLKQGRYNRLDAQEKGLKFYESRACKSCKTTTRYTSSGGCVLCAAKRYHGEDVSQTYNQVQWRQNRQLSLTNGLTQYHGKACKTCSSTLRYTSTKACIECHKRIRDAGSKRRRQATNPEERNLQAKKNRIQSMLSSAKHRTKARGMEFDLREEQVVIPEHCPVLGIPLSWDGDVSNSPSLDRVDNTRGYTEDNVAVISNRANSIKRDATLDELKKLTHYVEKYLHPG